MKLNRKHLQYPIVLAWGVACGYGMVVSWPASAPVLALIGIVVAVYITLWAFDDRR